MTRLIVVSALFGALLVAAAVPVVSDERPDGARHGFARFPFVARGPVSAAIGKDDPRYRVVGLSARNPAEHLAASFSRHGVRFASGPAHFRLRLVGSGAARPRVAANRVSYRHGAVDEWYANGPMGLEQGFDVRSRPSAGGPLTISMAVASNLRARAGRAGITFHGRGRTLRYGGLSASDARGRALPATLRLSDRRLQIRVEDRHAAYPVRVDPFVRSAALTASDGVAGDAFGGSVAVDGDTIVATDVFPQSQGGAYVFQKPASGWANATQIAKLTASDGSTGDPLGPVAISGDTIVAGAPAHKVGQNGGQGAVYVFVKPPAGWKDATQTAELTATDGAVNETLGSAVGVSGDTVVASAVGHKVGTHDQQGAAYVFVKPPTIWKDATQTAELTASDGVGRDFLDAVAISGDTIVAGSAHHQVGANTDQGVAYVFLKPLAGWMDMTESGELTSSDGGADDLFGFVVSISGGTIVVGAPFHHVGLAQQGAAYVFVKGVGFFDKRQQTAELTASDGATNDRFGSAVGVSGDRVVVGSLLHQVGRNEVQGAGYLFEKPGDTWPSHMNQTQELTASDGAAREALGDAVAISGNTLVASVPLRTIGDNLAQGALLVFGPSPTIAIGTPADGATFTRRQVVRASYSCRAPAGATITACAGPVANGAAIDTSTIGPHTFSVDAHDSDGVAVRQSASYTVVAAFAISGARQSASAWREGRKLARAAGRRRRGHKPPPVGTTFSFRLNQPARVALQFTRRRPAGTLRVSGHAGVNKVRFQGRLSAKRKLKPGRYTVRITATNAAGTKVKSRALRFTIVR